MKFTTSRENLLTPLQQVVGVIERRQTLPILSNVLIRLADDRLEFTGTDLEVQLVTHSTADTGEDGAITVPARKLLDICRLLPDGSTVSVDCREDKLAIHSGRSRFSLSTLPAENYPAFDSNEPDVELNLSAPILKKAMEKTLFAMAQQDVRYYLNGLLLDVDRRRLRTVSSDGHRLAVYEEALENPELEPRQVIIPRKGVLELYRLLDDHEEPIILQIASNNIRLFQKSLSFSAKLIEGRYPDVQRVMPRDITKIIHLDREAFRSALTRVAILSNDKIKGISLDVKGGLMSLQAQNPEHEEAEEELEVRLEGEGLAVGFNASYLLDAINNVDSSEVKLSFTDAANSCLIEDTENPNFKFIVMPMKL
ncbi:MAG: DNA polymerase III subunit beta [Methylococcaceae bacterium]|nr:DNA polymerase III subunit beta [Methylococcaceae bacterium]